jgi:uncharacterized protein (DUF1919 family)
LVFFILKACQGTLVFSTPYYLFTSCWGATIHSYLDTKIHLLFKPILTYLITSDSVRSTTEINAYLRQKLQFSPNDLEALSFTYEWLSRKGILQRVSVPVRLTEKSKVTLNEAAYYYDDKDKSKEVNDATDD